MAFIKKLKISVTLANGEVIETEFEGAIVLKYDVEYDVERIDGLRAALAHNGRFSLKLEASGTDKSLGEDWLRTLKEAYEP
jgi:uncharacterized protein (AIM24 family)